MDKPQAKNPSRNVIRKAKPAQSNNAGRSVSAVTAAVRSTLMALEPRMLFDGAALATADAMADQRDAQATSDRSVWSEGLRDNAIAYSTSAPTNLLVVDQRVQGWQELAANVKEGTQVLVLDANQDGVSQIARAVSGMSGLQSIQILSHGDPGQMALGSSTIDTAGLGAYTSELAAIGGALAPTGDILLFGCDIAAGTSGVSFIQALARATQADVAASTDATGALALGGDWLLETGAGSIEAGSVLNAEQQAAYGSLLDLNVVGTGGTLSIEGHIFDNSGRPDAYLNTTPVLIGALAPAAGGDPLENCLSEVTVRLIYAGADGNFQTNAGDTTAQGDDTILTVITGDRPEEVGVPGYDTYGRYKFENLAAGNYKIVVPTLLTDPIGQTVDATTGAVRNYGSGNLKIQSDVGTVGPEDDGVIDLRLTANAEDQHFRYVQINDPPLVTVPGAQTITEDNQLIFDNSPGKLIVLADSVNDPINFVNSFSDYCVTVTVNSGILGFSPVAGVTATGELTNRLQLTGRLADLNNAIQGLIYRPNTDFAGTDTMTVKLDDKGNVGDVDGDNIPDEAVDDNLSDTKTIVINVTGAPDAPVGVNDMASLCWSSDPISGNVLRNDTDVDTANSALRVCGVESGGFVGTPTSNIGTSFTNASPSDFGTVVINADGSYTYRVNLANARVIALAQAGTTGSPLIDRFTYCVTDAEGNTSKAELVIQINPNAVPIAVADTNNLTVGTSTTASGNVLPNDSDPDGDRTKLAICGVTDVNGTLTSPPTYVGIGATIPGANGFGSLVMQSNGSYVFTLNAAAAAGIPAGTSRTEVFQYCVVDECGGCEKTTLTITINSPPPVQLPPVATPDAFTFCVGQTPPTGSVLVNDTDPNGDPLAVCGVVAGDQATVPTTGIGTAVTSANGYGSLTINANGTYVYVLNPANPTVAALTPSSPALTDVYTYCVTDGQGNQVRTTVTITICPPDNAPPVARPDAICIEANRAEPVLGNVVTGVGANGSDTDPNRDTLTVQGAAAGSSTATLTTGAGIELNGQYGTLALNPDGFFAYILNPNAPAVLAAKPGDPQLNDVFTYTINDGRGGTSTSTLTICIDGVNDCPVPANDANTVSAATGSNTGGNVLGGPGASAGDRADIDPDGDRLTVCGVTAGAVASAPNVGVGAPIAGQYGSLTLNADGSYTYTIDSTKPAVAALKPGQTISETFTYCVTDGTCEPQLAQLVVTVTGVNKPPVATGRPDMTTENGDIKCDLIGVSDPDNTNPELRITIDSISNPNSGVFFLREPIAGQPGQFRETIVMPGMQITGEQAQYLCFRPNPAANAPRGPDGALLPPTLTFTVRDPDGSTAQAQTTITIKPPVQPVPPVVPPVIGVVPPTLVPLPPVLPAVNPPPLRELPPTAFVPLDLSPPLDAVSLFAPQPFLGDAKALDVPTVKSTVAEAAPAVKAEADCIPVKPKVKPKAVKRAVFTDDRPAAKFSEQIKVAKQRFKLPPKVAPKPAVGKDC